MRHCYAACRCLLDPLDGKLLPPPDSGLSSLQQAVAALLADGSLALFECLELDLWEETLEEQQGALAEAEACLQAKPVHMEAHDELHDGLRMRFGPPPPHPNWFYRPHGGLTDFLKRGVFMCSIS